ncbi:MAG: hypothetical protein A2951_02735 [Candidatus Buchananbacteria bacterium RIFCSPLOWO2_01_FULL_56_15]|uniref:YggT family protein n=2 Tax=Candidatus Buchananiibacteriota TaxID=1817903 RepID=A0A1G1YI24_9BACT|nr:MAG: hypothetical protein A3J59_03765 [Candidatus Buchananbacteria bacterium RIFCSPHIGHO2_02_FULL_56_16]OGY54703.1 MAG: hypothetical protein A2951_02735 [Candidatus Buchananbacteria bacterium RIFCSPLOWO2_01_FULL_56_15]
MNSYTSIRTKTLSRGSEILWYIVDAIEALLLLRFALRLFVANPAAWFTRWVNVATDPLVAPFVSVFRITRVEGNVFEWTTLLAMVVYWLLGAAIIRLLLIGRDIRDQAAIELNQEHK